MKNKHKFYIIQSIVAGIFLIPLALISSDCEVKGRCLRNGQDAGACDKIGITKKLFSSK